MNATEHNIAQIVVWGAGRRSDAKQRGGGGGGGKCVASSQLEFHQFRSRSEGGRKRRRRRRRRGKEEVRTGSDFEGRGRRQKRWQKFVGSEDGRRRFLKGGFGERAVVLPRISEFSPWQRQSSGRAAADVRAKFVMVPTSTLPEKAFVVHSRFSSSSERVCANAVKPMNHYAGYCGEGVGFTAPTSGEKWPDDLRVSATYLLRRQT